MQDGVFGEQITTVPQLKDCRGKVVIQAGERMDYIGAIDFEEAGLEKISQKGGYKDNANEKISNIRNFYNDAERVVL